MRLPHEKAMFVLAMLSLATLCWAGSAREDATERLDNAKQVVHEIMGMPDKGIPEEVLEHAKCIAVVPHMVKGGFVFGGKGGNGVATCRTADGWSAPAFITISGGSWGLQIGVEAVDDRAVAPAREAGAPYNPPANRGGSQPRANNSAPRPENNVPPPNAIHAKDIQPHARPTPPNSGTPKQDQKYQQQQQKLFVQQEQEYQKLQQKQEQDHQRLAQQKANEARTQQIEQKHTQQQQKLQTKQQPATRNESRLPR